MELSHNIGAVWGFSVAVSLAEVRLWTKYLWRPSWRGSAQEVWVKRAEEGWLQLLVAWRGSLVPPVLAWTVVFHTWLKLT